MTLRSRSKTIDLPVVFVSLLIVLAPVTAIAANVQTSDLPSIFGFSAGHSSIPNGHHSLEEAGRIKILPRSATEMPGKTFPGHKRLAGYTNLVSSLDAEDQLPVKGETETGAADNRGISTAGKPTAPTNQVMLPPLCGPSGLSPSEIRQLVIKTARDQQVDEDFALAIAFVESGFDRRRNSPKGARGVMQLMPSTAERFGVLDVCDPRANIAGGTQYLRFLHDTFRNPLLVAAAYNAGENRIYEYGGIPPFAETVSYVAKVINYQLGITIAPAVSTKVLRPPRRGVGKDEPETGVFPILKDGKFTGGVMHF